ncbi:large conductance mechanosensitive channel protein MscL [Deinococcus irradiatisoli]|uniref:Large-conductance mechanosensitive channel n=1 Tax=Deinococcus irradiatisoli TaxID=2202254 RepID=A0A2Z3JEI5_9DEIO|nr:large conductance mechanosensitive channel protein MscL [Deinococcus irradiatisoli]AWN22396.1 large conductance mechanosensitive channel protein MscL [Deinococcus irradiatisoli]
MWSGFEKFLLRGNVVDLAVGVVMGAAFGNVVTAFTKAFLEPLIRLTGGGRVAGTLVLRPPRVVDGLDIPPLVLDYGSFLTALIGFVLTAAVIYFFVVVPINTLMERFKRQEKPSEEEVSNEEKLLAEIRDLLKQQVPMQPSAQVPEAPLSD